MGVRVGCGAGQRYRYLDPGPGTEPAGTYSVTTDQFSIDYNHDGTPEITLGWDPSHEGYYRGGTNWDNCTTRVTFQYLGVIWVWNEWTRNSPSDQWPTLPTESGHIIQEYPV